jgi:cellulose synthase/poly-beta-1,6-N-acetylglucosamine synthase-like glycosyltransferase
MSQTLFIFYVIFLAYWLSLNFTYLMLLVLAFTGSVRRLNEARFTDFELLSKSYLTIPVSIIIPAFNEEVGIVNVVKSAVKSDYPEAEVIVVNDGSTDRTLPLLETEFDLQAQDAFYRRPLITKSVRGVYRSRTFPNLWVIDKENGGKADAANAGVNLARYRYVVIIDGDCLFHHRGLLRMIRTVNMDPERIVGVGGQIRVGNGLEIKDGLVVKKRLPHELVANFQVIEYLGSFLGNRVGWSEVNSVLVVAGAFGLWRRDLLLELGGLTTETTHEDIEFTFRVHEALHRREEPYWIAFLPDPVVWTEVPSRWRDLFVQRRRWQRVVNEVAWRYKRMFLNPRYGSVGMTGMPYLVVYESLGPMIEIASYAVVIVAYLTGRLPLELLGLFLLVSFGLTAVVRMAGVFVEQYSFRTYPIRALPRLFLLALGSTVGYHQYIMIARILGFIDVLMGRKTWERVERKGFQPPAEEEKEVA